jgi:hypothetical protein
MVHRRRVKRRAHDEALPMIADGCACMGGGHMKILERRPGGPGLDGSAGKGTAAGLAGTKTDRWIGMWSARVLAAFGVAYAVTMVAGFAAMGNLSKPLEDPYLAIMEVLILVMAPVLVLLAVVIHACAPEGTKTYSTTALGWMLLVAGFTMTVHLVQLTVVRRIDSGAIHGFQYLFNWHWPSVLYGVDIVAWDIFSPWPCCSPLRCSTRRAGGRTQRAADRRRDVRAGHHRPSRQSHCPPPDRDHRLRDRLAHRLRPAQQGIPASRTALRRGRACARPRRGACVATYGPRELAPRLLTLNGPDCGGCGRSRPASVSFGIAA